MFIAIRKPTKFSFRRLSSQSASKEENKLKCISNLKLNDANSNKKEEKCRKSQKKLEKKTFYIFQINNKSQKKIKNLLM